MCCIFLVSIIVSEDFLNSHILIEVSREAEKINIEFFYSFTIISFTLLVCPNIGFK